MTPAEKDELIKKFEEEVAKAENPDQPIIGAGSKTYSLRQILDEVKRETPFGLGYLEKMAFLLFSR